MAGTTYQVTAAAVVAKLKDARPPEVYLYRGALLPENADPEHVKHLLSSGLVAKVQAPVEVVAAPVAEDPVVQSTGGVQGAQPKASTPAAKK